MYSYRSCKSANHLNEQFGLCLANFAISSAVVVAKEKNGMNRTNAYPRFLDPLSNERSIDLRN